MNLLMLGIWSTTPKTKKTELFCWNSVFTWVNTVPATGTVIKTIILD